MGKSRKHKEEDDKGDKKRRKRGTARYASWVQKKRGKTARNGKVKYSLPLDQADDDDGSVDNDEDEDDDC